MVRPCLLDNDCFLKIGDHENVFLVQDRRDAGRAQLQRQAAGSGQDQSPSRLELDQRASGRVQEQGTSGHLSTTSSYTPNSEVHPPCHLL